MHAPSACSQASQARKVMGHVLFLDSTLVERAPFLPPLHLPRLDMNLNFTLPRLDFAWPPIEFWG